MTHSILVFLRVQPSGNAVHLLLLYCFHALTLKYNASRYATGSQLNRHGLGFSPILIIYRIFFSTTILYMSVIVFITVTKIILCSFCKSLRILCLPKLPFCFPRAVLRISSQKHWFIKSRVAMEYFSTHNRLIHIYVYIFEGFC